MFYYLTHYVLEQTAGTAWEEYLSPLRVFQYITFRSAGAALTALLLSLWLGPRILKGLRRLKFGQDYADKAEENGNFAQRILSKKGTPTMGGVLIVLALDVATILWAQWNTLVQLTILSILVLTALGLIDDYRKIIWQSSRGIDSLTKLAVQGGLGLFLALYLWQVPSTSAIISEFRVPFFKDPVAMGGLGALLGIVVTVATIVGSSNAVNLTDGLDGLAIGCAVIVAFVFLILTWITGNANAADYLLMPYIPGAGELTVVCSALIGAGLGFLWFNCHPAQVFMGDTGSLAIGGGLGIIAVLIQQPFVLLLAGGVFVAEALSVLLQSGYFKYTRRRYGVGSRIFLMAPLHHHFEKKGWYESQVVIRFYILCVLCAVVALSTIKLR